MEKQPGREPDRPPAAGKPEGNGSGLSSWVPEGGQTANLPPKLEGLTEAEIQEWLVPPDTPDAPLIPPPQPPPAEKPPTESGREQYEARRSEPPTPETLRRETGVLKRLNGSSAPAVKPSRAELAFPRLADQVEARLHTIEQRIEQATASIRELSQKPRRQ